MIDVGEDLIGTVKTNIKGFCMNDILKLTKDWYGGSYLMFRRKPMLPCVRPLIVIGYKYNMQQVLYFIVTDNSGSTKAILPCLYKYPDHFLIFTLALFLAPLSFISYMDILMRLTLTSNIGKSDLELKKFWVTQCGWLWLFTGCYGNYCDFFLETI